ncbi:helix-turn-helix domain-containing protein [Marinobacterium stanieri]|uniref:helix-turn-helix domain-containing protein n=1 Tax=Marinobacterium stanieri TaxID=49186 RepID=UPI003A903A20
MNSCVFNSIFDSVTDNPEEASELQNRSDLMITIRSIVEEKGWCQEEAADHLGLTQPSVNDLLSGKIDNFSIDVLMACWYRVGL